MKYGNVIDPGRDGTRRHIWLCADDYGMSPAVNVAIRDLIVRGRINATSVMVVAPNFNRSEAVSLNIPRIPLSDRQLVSQPARRAWPHAAAPAVDKLLICGRWGGGAMPNDRSGPIDR
jgi:hypothetical protein